MLENISIDVNTFDPMVAFYHELFTKLYIAITVNFRALICSSKRVQLINITSHVTAPLSKKKKIDGSFLWFILS